MAEERNDKYPYLGKYSLGDQSYVVFFTEPNHGVIVMSDVTDDERLMTGSTTYGFDERYFEYLDPEDSVRLNNAPLEGEEDGDNTEDDNE